MKLYWIHKKAVDLNKVTDHQSRYFWTQMSKAGYRTKEPAELDISIEKLTIMEDILEVHQIDFKYFTEDLSAVTFFTKDEFQEIYSTVKLRLKRGRVRKLV